MRCRPKMSNNPILCRKLYPPCRSRCLEPPVRMGCLMLRLLLCLTKIDALNYSLDPWERTGAAPQGWATHPQQAMVPIQGYIQLRPQTGGSLPAFGVSSQSAPGCNGDTDSGVQHAPRRIGKASPSVSIFARDPLCKNTCRYCRCRPCDVGVEHDDHTCYDCEQRLLHPEGVPGAPWQPPADAGL